MKKLEAIICLLFVLDFTAAAQQNLTDSLTFSALNKSRWQFFLDDTYLFAGINTSGIYYSNHSRQLSHSAGYTIGIDQYIPVSPQVFLTTGINFSNRNFSYLKHNPSISVKNYYLDIPIVTAFELPVLKRFDFRLLLGANMGMRLHSRVEGNYDQIRNLHPDAFVYNTSDFHRFDFGWQFGLSAEHRNFLVRARSYSGFVKLDKKEQGMLSSFNFELGYFLFRGTSNNYRKP